MDRATAEALRSLLGYLEKLCLERWAKAVKAAIEELEREEDDGK